jgi:hypothetical protein
VRKLLKIEGKQRDGEKGKVKYLSEKSDEE